METTRAREEAQRGLMLRSEMGQRLEQVEQAQRQRERQLQQEMATTSEERTAALRRQLSSELAAAQEKAEQQVVESGAELGAQREKAERAEQLVFQQQLEWVRAGRPPAQPLTNPLCVCLRLSVQRRPRSEAHVGSPSVARGVFTTRRRLLRVALRRAHTPALAPGLRERSSATAA